MTHNFNRPLSLRIDRIVCALDSRLRRHEAGDGSAFMREVARRGIQWQLVRTWPGGTRRKEKQLRGQHNHARFCPICGKEHGKE